MDLFEEAEHFEDDWELMGHQFDNATGYFNEVEDYSSTIDYLKFNEMWDSTLDFIVALPEKGDF